MIDNNNDMDNNDKNNNEKITAITIMGTVT